MSFAVLPPEVTSAQMYSGAGSGPMLAAAASWNGLGSELGAAAESFSSVTSDLVSGSWRGAASAAMATVATQYAQWLSTAAAQAVGAAAHAKAIAGVFEAAKAAVAHPMAVAANRAQLVSLVRSNLLGFNAPAIAATEGTYEAMWAQNVAALAGYHGAASAVVAQLTPWQQVMETNKADFTNLQRFAKFQIADAKASTNSDLGAAGAAFNASRFGVAAQDVGKAGLIDTGTGLEVAARVEAFPLSVAGQDLVILGGGGGAVIGRGPAAVLQQAVPISPPPTSGGVFGQIVATDRADWTNFQNTTRIQLSHAGALTDGDFTAAGTAFGSGRFGLAAQDVGKAGLIDTGTGLEVAARAESLPLSVAGEDLVILGGGSGVVTAPPPPPAM